MFTYVKLGNPLEFTNKGFDWRADVTENGLANTSQRLVQKALFFQTSMHLLPVSQITGTYILYIPANNIY